MKYMLSRQTRNHSMAVFAEYIGTLAWFLGTAIYMSI